MFVSIASNIKHICIPRNEHLAVKLLMPKPRGRARITEKAECLEVEDFF